MPSVACCINVYNEHLALPGALESASSSFDDIYVIHAGPGGRPSNDGTMEILEKWGIKPDMQDISIGFGAIRTMLIHNCGCDWGYIMDADERFHEYAPSLKANGTEKYPDSKNPDVRVEQAGMPYNQAKFMRELLGDIEEDVVVGRRRHWLDFSWQRPAQNFDIIEDWQCRLMRNNGHVGFDPKVKLHERIIDFRNNGQPSMHWQPKSARAVFWDHYHNFFKPIHGKKNSEDLATYRALDERGTQSMWLNEAPKE